MDEWLTSGKAIVSRRAFRWNSRQIWREWSPIIRIRGHWRMLASLLNSSQKINWVSYAALSRFYYCCENFLIDYDYVSCYFREENHRWPFCNRTRCRWNLWGTMETSSSEIGTTDNEMAGIRVKTRDANRSINSVFLRAWAYFRFMLTLWIFKRVIDNVVIEEYLGEHLWIRNYIVYKLFVKFIFAGSYDFIARRYTWTKVFYPFICTYRSFYATVPDSKAEKSRS